MEGWNNGWVEEQRSPSNAVQSNLFLKGVFPQSKLLFIKKSPPFNKIKSILPDVFFLMSTRRGYHYYTVRFTFLP